MIEAILYSSNVWLIIGLTLAIIELTNGTLIFFLPMGISGLIVGFVLKFQEDSTSFIILNDWASTTVTWAILSLLLSLLMNLIVKRKTKIKDVNKY
tara:strand:- start:63 stop:350 length:288 start_codon:yes stop_codon:yes gene_type:complete